MAMFNKKNFLVTLFFVILIFIITSIVFYYKTNKKDELKNLVVETYNKFNEDGKIKSIDYARARAIENITECENLLSTENIQMCVFKLVKSTDDCNVLHDLKNKEACENFFKVRDVVITKNPVNCYSVSTSSVSGCLDSIFFELEVKDSCDNLKEGDKGRCFDIINYKKAVGGNKQEDCSSISAELLKKDCINTIINKPADADNDGFVDYMELSFGTDPFSPDTDKDGLPDGYEIYTALTNPLVVDTDNDELSDGDEINAYKTDPNKKDTDADGYKDGAEVEAGFSPVGPGKLIK